MRSHDAQMDFGDTYMRLFNASFQALKAVSPKLRVGGPATMELRSVRDFLEAQAKWGTAADFVSTHSYHLCIKSIPDRIL
jgi:xylan 1,4-beta-xylosidase